MRGVAAGIDHKAVGFAWNPMVGHRAEGTGMKGQVPGVGPLTSAILVAHLPELGQKVLTALAGLAPWPGTAASSAAIGPSEVGEV